MSKAVTQKEINLDAINKALMYGDLSKLTEQDKLEHYNRVCFSVGLNPITVPFQYINMNGKQVLYAGKNTAEQLRSIHKISIDITSREIQEDVFIVTAKASMPDGRHDESVGAVVIKGLVGESKANTIMKCETKAKRRVTLSICGLGMLDETEVETLPKEAIAKPQEILKEASEATAQPSRPDDGFPHCKTCNEEMVISKDGVRYWCRNWQDGRKHQPILVSKVKNPVIESEESGGYPYDKSFEDYEK
jgi:hypothetical protein